MSDFIEIPEAFNRPSLLLMRAAVLLSQFEQREHFYGTDVPIYNAEIHLLRAINEAEITTVSALSEALRVTKGAVSQLATKLYDKGLLHKTQDQNNLSRFNLSLSEKGKSACAHYAQLFSSFDQAVDDLLAKAPEDNKLFLNQFLASIIFLLEKKRSIS